MSISIFILLLTRPVRVCFSYTVRWPETCCSRDELFPLKSAWKLWGNFRMDIVISLAQRTDSAREVFYFPSKASFQSHTLVRVLFRHTGMIRNRVWYKVYEALSVWLCHRSAKHMGRCKATFSRSSTHPPFIYIRLAAVCNGIIQSDYWIYHRTNCIFIICSC